MSSQRLPVVVYGATGYTGRLLCEELDRQQIPFAIGGRDPDKLRELSGRLRSKPEAVVAALEDAAALRSFAGRGRVLVSCAGPFVRFGKPVQDAALEAGAHWLDTTGEHPFITATFARDTEAREAGVVLVNAVGLDIVPSDAAAALAAEGLADVEELRLAVASRGGASRGTLRSALEIFAAQPVAWVDGRLSPERPGAAHWKAPFPPPVGELECISLPLADVAAAPRSTGAKTMRAFAPAPALARKLTSVAGLGARALRLPGARRVVDALLHTLPEGPGDAARDRGAFAVVAEARFGDGQVRRAWVTGGEAYRFTASAATLCARLAATTGFAQVGALTPSQAFGARALLDGLAEAGVRWGVEG